MSYYSGFNNLEGSVRNANATAAQTTKTINAFNRSVNPTETLAPTIANRTNNSSSTARNMRATQGAVDNYINGGVNAAGAVGSGVRMSTNAEQNITRGAGPVKRTTTLAVVKQQVTDKNTVDWRVRIEIPEILRTGELCSMFNDTNGSMIFPFTPTILFGHSANYSQIHPTHTNYAFNAYENSQVDNITITGEFVNENEDDAKYWLACLRVLRSATKMFYGESPQHLGNPPVVCKLYGYGPSVLPGVPVLITNFTTDLPADVDYISCNAEGETNYVPTQSVFTVTCAPNYARRTVSSFSLENFVNNKSDQGFI